MVLYSNIVFLNTVGIKDLDNSSFTLYPNPVNTVLNIQMSQISELASLRITDVLGQELSYLDIDTRNISEEFKIDLSAIPHGMYFVIVETANNKIVKRFVKN